MRIIMDVRKPQDDLWSAMKDFPQLDGNIPAVGSNVYFSARRKGDIVPTKVVDIEYMLDHSMFIKIMCELDSAEEAIEFTVEGGWNISGA